MADMLLTQADIDSYINGGLYIQGNTLAKVGMRYIKNYTIDYKTTLKDWIVDSVTLVDGSVPFTRIVGTNNFRLIYPYDYSDKGLGVIVEGRFKVYYVNQLDIDVVNSANAKLYVNDILATSETVVKNGDIVKIIADDGYKFYLDNKGRFSFSAQYQNVVKSYDMLSVSFVIVEVRDRFISEIDTTIRPFEKVAGVNNVYELEKIAARNFLSKNWIDTTTPFTPIQINSLIISLLRIPFTVPSSMIGGVGSVWLGGYDTKEPAIILNDDELIIDIGFIDIPLIKNNMLDFKNTVCILNMPYVEKMFLETRDVIGERITIKYIINLYTSLTTVNVTSSSTNKVIASKTIDLNFQIPFGNVETPPRGSSATDVDFKQNNGIKTAFIEVIRDDVLLEDGLFTIPIIDEDILNSQNGFIQVEEIDLICKATSREKQHIINILNNGVIIK